MHLSLLYTAWKKLMLAYLISYGVSLLAGVVLLNVIPVAPQTIFELSTKRLAYAAPVMEIGARAGIDAGVILFVWNSFGALVTMSFVFSAMLFNPLDIHKTPRAIRRIFCSPAPMKLLCFLPGCRKIEAESLRRLYVWLMVPLLGMILLGVETGLSASTARDIFGSYLAGIVSLLPHGIVEIPAMALAGAVTYSAHLLIKPRLPDRGVAEVFQDVKAYKSDLPVKKIALVVIFCLLLAGLIEAHFTAGLV